MLAYGATVTVNDGSRTKALRRFLRHEFGVVPGRHEAKLLAFTLVRAGQHQALRFCAHGCLVELAERKDEARERRLAERVQEIALILGSVASPMELEPTAALDEPRVVARRNARRAESVGEP